jgi:hypothetical protein
MLWLALLHSPTRYQQQEEGHRLLCMHQALGVAASQSLLVLAYVLLLN